MLALLVICITVSVYADNGGFPLPVQQLNYSEVENELIFDGTLEAVQRATVSAQVSGRIEDIFFDVDDFVARDAIILRFRDKEQKARLETAKAELQESQARYEEAKKEHVRNQELFQQKLVARSALDRALANHDASRAQLDAAESRLQEAQEQLEQTVVRAPYSGIVVTRHVDAGGSANVGQPLMTGLSLDQLRVVVDLPQKYVERVRKADTVFLLLPGDEKVMMDRAEMVVFPFADPASHTFRVRLNLPPGMQRLYPGMWVKTGFVSGTAKELLVPETAVAYRSEVTAVYVMSDQGDVGMRQVRLGKRYNDQVVVLSGLHAGEKVVLDPVRASVYLKEQ
jgi:RND family efflux transporter MFP subunit